jgi:hypothetical protein
MTFQDSYAAKFAAESNWGHFLDHPVPLAEQEDPSALLPWKGMTLQHRTTTAIDTTWNEIAARINAFPYPTSDQCSEKHYQDVFEFLRINRDVVDRVFECGVFHGGMSVLLAGCALAFDFCLDLIDVNPAALQSTFHRIRRTFPEALPKIRIFLGEIPNYVKAVMQDSEFKNAILHHDGSHRFNTVVNDLSSLYFVRSNVHAILIQDTHLRHSDPANYCFVDAAVAAVFGVDPRYQPIGTTYPMDVYSPAIDWEKGTNDVYFLEGRPEGMIIPLAENRFLYPTSMHKIDDFISFPAQG